LLSLLSKPIARGAGATAFAATVCVTAAVLAADAARVAAAQGRLEAEYTASVAGIPIGRGNWVIDISEDQFTAAASGATTGILKFFTGAHGVGASRGVVNPGSRCRLTTARPSTTTRRSTTSVSRCRAAM
jgi:hypothetical protein